MDDITERKARVRALQNWLNSQEINVGDTAVLALDVLALSLVQMSRSRQDAVAAARAAADDIILDIQRLWDARV